MDYETRMILVTGATGQVGREVTKQLIQKGIKPRVLARKPEAARATFGDAVDVVEGDMHVASDLAKALEGVSRAFVLSIMPNLTEGDVLFAREAKRANVEQVVKISTLGAERAQSGISLWHREGEKAFEASGLAFTFVRPCGFMSNSLGWVNMIKKTGKVFAATGEGKTAQIHPADIAAVAVCALTEDGHAGKKYEITGGESLTTREMVATLAKATGKPLEFVDIPEDVARDNMLKTQMPADMVESIIGFMRMVREGRADLVTTTVFDVTKTAPRTFARWAEENAPAFA